MWQMPHTSSSVVHVQLATACQLFTSTFIAATIGDRLAGRRRAPTPGARVHVAAPASSMATLRLEPREPRVRALGPDGEVEREPSPSEAERHLAVLRRLPLGALMAASRDACVDADAHAHAASDGDGETATGEHGGVEARALAHRLAIERLSAATSEASQLVHLLSLLRDDRHLTHAHVAPAASPPAEVGDAEGALGMHRKEAEMGAAAAALRRGAESIERELRADGTARAQARQLRAHWPLLHASSCGGAAMVGDGACGVARHALRLRIGAPSVPDGAAAPLLRGADVHVATDAGGRFVVPRHVSHAPTERVHVGATSDNDASGCVGRGGAGGGCGVSVGDGVDMLQSALAAAESSLCSSSLFRAIAAEARGVEGGGPGGAELLRIAPREVEAEFAGTSFHVALTRDARAPLAAPPAAPMAAPVAPMDVRLLSRWLSVRRSDDGGADADEACAEAPPSKKRRGESPRVGRGRPLLGWLGDAATVDALRADAQAHLDAVAACWTDPSIRVHWDFAVGAAADAPPACVAELRVLCAGGVTRGLGARVALAASALIHGGGIRISPIGGCGAGADAAEADALADFCGADARSAQLGATDGGAALGALVHAVSLATCSFWFVSSYSDTTLAWPDGFTASAENLPTVPAVTTL